MVTFIYNRRELIYSYIYVHYDFSDNWFMLSSLICDYKFVNVWWFISVCKATAYKALFFAIGILFERTN